MAARNSDRIRYSSRGENASPNSVMMVVSRNDSTCWGCRRYRHLAR